MKKHLTLPNLLLLLLIALAITAILTHYHPHG